MKHKVGDLLKFTDPEAADPKNRLAYCILVDINKYDFTVEWLDVVHDPNVRTIFDRTSLRYFTRLP